MNGTLEMAKKGRHDEQVQFAAHGQFCEDIAVEKKRATHDANEQIDGFRWGGYRGNRRTGTTQIPISME